MELRKIIIGCECFFLLHNGSKTQIPLKQPPETQVFNKTSIKTKSSMEINIYQHRQTARTTSLQACQKCGGLLVSANY